MYSEDVLCPRFSSWGKTAIVIQPQTSQEVKELEWVWIGYLFQTDVTTSELPPLLTDHLHHSWSTRATSSESLDYTVYDPKLMEISSEGTASREIFLDNSESVLQRLLQTVDLQFLQIPR